MNKLPNLLLVSLLLSLAPVASRAELTFGPGPEAAGSALDIIVAVVEDDVITRRELDRETARIETQLRRNKAAIPPRAILESQVLERLIMSQLQFRAAERNGISVDDATLNAAIETLAQRNNMGLAQLRQTVERDGASFAQFRDEVRRELMSARLRQKLVDSQIQVSEQDVENLQSQQGGAERGANARSGPREEERTAGGPPEESSGQRAGGGRQYRMAQILIALPENASPQQIEEKKRQAEAVLAQLRQGTDFRQTAMRVSTDQQAKQGGEIGWRSAEQLPTLFSEAAPRLQPGQISELIRSPSGFHIVKLLEVRGGGVTSKAASSKPTPPPAQGMVNQTRVRHILLKISPQRSEDQARQQLEEWRRKLREGADFAEIARTYSDDKASGERGGDLGWLAPGMVVPPFEQAMNALKPNEVSAPLKTSFGWHLIQVLERRQGAATPELTRARTREALMRRRSDEEWALALRRLRDEAYVEIRLPQAGAAAAATGIPSEPTNLQ